MHSAENNSPPSSGHAALGAGIVLLPYGGQQLYFTEMHIDLFRIVNEHVELGVGTGGQPLCDCCVPLLYAYGVCSRARGVSTL